MTAGMRAASDPLDGVVHPLGAADSAGSPPDSAGAATAPASWSDLEAAVRRIGEHALTANLARAADVQEALSLAGAGRLDEDRRLTAVQAAHQLVGSAGTFGFPGASDLAGELESFLAHGVFDEQHLQTAAGQATALLAELLTKPDY